MVPAGVNDDGEVPSVDGDWGDWVSATAVRNWLLDDPLVDWLDLYGPTRGYVPDQDLGGYDPRMDFTKFVLDQGRRFEEAVLPVLASHGLEVVAVRDPDGSSRDPLLARRTVELLEEGIPAVWQGVLHDATSRTYGVPDLLVRSDVVNRIWPGTIDDAGASTPAPGLSAAAHHYVVIDVKFTTLHLTAAGDLGNAGSHPLYKVQLAMMNRALGRIQGYDPPSAYLIGRGWEQKVKGETTRARSCMDRLGRIDLSKDLPKRGPILIAADEAAQWIREVRSLGAAWEVLPVPARPELYPNLGNDRDAPWHGAKRRIIEELEDLSVLWQVGPAGKRLGHEAGVFRWTDAACTAELLGLKGDRAETLEALLEINRSADGPFAAPAQIPTDRETWHPIPLLEFYVDFETVNDLADDFTSMPERGGQQLIFMVGCGHIEDGKWTFRTFTARHLTEEAEAEMLDGWFSHMAEVTAALAPGSQPRIVHWSPAETSVLESAYNSAQERHGRNEWGDLNWYDFLGRVVRPTPVVVRGAMGFGLKSFAKALARHGAIETTWEDGPTDGLGAMMGAWWCADVARQSQQEFHEVSPMRDIEKYNEVDCKVMMEAVAYLRAHH